MLILLALLERLAPLLPQSVRAFAQRQLHRYIQRRLACATPTDAAFLTSLADALVDAAHTREETTQAIAFAHRVSNTLIDLDRSGHFLTRRPRRMRNLRSHQRGRAPALPDARAFRALELSG